MYLPVINHFFTIIVLEGKEQGTYQSSLYSMNTQHLFISIPQMEGNRLLKILPPGTKVILDYQDAKDIPCRFETVVDELLDGSQSDLLALKCPQKIERHQRREEVRVPLSRPIAFTYQFETIMATMNDLSGGGLSAWIPKQYQMNIGDLLELKFDINEGKHSTSIHTGAQVVSAEKGAEDDNQYLCSVKFTSLEDTLRQRITEIVFNRQKLDIALRNVGRGVVF